MQILVRLDGAVAQILNRLLELGYYKTKSEALRAGLLELGKEHLSPEREAELVVRKMRQMRREERRAGTKLIPLEDVLKEYGLTKRDLR